MGHMCYIQCMRRQFAQRARLAIYLEFDDLARLTEKARSLGKTVVEYVRAVILERLGDADRGAKDVPGDRAVRVARRSAAEQERLPLAQEPAKVSLEDVVRSTAHREYAADSIEVMVAKRTGHEPGCDCMQCVQTTRWLTQQRQAAEPKKEKKR